jgi:hypothetical protein
MATPTIATEVGESLDIHGHLTSAVSFHGILPLNHLPDAIYIVTIQIITVHGIRKIHFIQDLACRCQSDAMYVCECPINMFVFRKVYS